MRPEWPYRCLSKMLHEDDVTADVEGRLVSFGQGKNKLGRNCNPQEPYRLPGCRLDHDKAYLMSRWH